MFSLHLVIAKLCSTLCNLCKSFKVRGRVRDLSKLCGRSHNWCCFMPSLSHHCPRGIIITFEGYLCICISGCGPYLPLFQLCKKGGGQNSYKYNPSIHGHHNDGDVDEKVDEGGGRWRGWCTTHNVPTNHTRSIVTGHNITYHWRSWGWIAKNETIQNHRIFVKWWRGRTKPGISFVWKRCPCRLQSVPKPLAIVAMSRGLHPNVQLCQLVFMRV